MTMNDAITLALNLLYGDILGWRIGTEQAALDSAEMLCLLSKSEFVAIGPFNDNKHKEKSYWRVVEYF